MTILRVAALSAVALIGCDRSDRRAISEAAEEQVDIARNDMDTLGDEAENGFKDLRREVEGQGSRVADEVDFDRNARPPE